MAAIQGHDRQALEKLYLGYYPRLARLLAHFATSRENIDENYQRYIHSYLDACKRLPARVQGFRPSIGYAPIRRNGTLQRVQRLFSMFPPGWPGLALILLRGSVATAVVLEGYIHRQELSG
jgi:hypothetical protein